MRSALRRWAAKHKFWLPSAKASRANSKAAQKKSLIKSLTLDEPQRAGLRSMGTPVLSLRTIIACSDLIPDVTRRIDAAFHPRRASMAIHDCGSVWINETSAMMPVFAPSLPIFASDFCRSAR